ncbi:MAG: extracellular solute-binding protein [Clostridia bacterium]|nr:extracellular solute-binding protein [Clostridia bacterium]
MKKFAVIAAAAAVSLALSGCGEKDTAKNSIGEFKGYPMDTDETLTYWAPMGGDLATIYPNTGETPFAKELEKRTGIHVEYIHPAAGQEEQSLSLLVASDELPDIVHYNWYNYQGGPQKSIDNEIILRLNDRMEEHAPNLTKYLSENPDFDKMVKTDKGDYYVFPFIRSDARLLKSTGPMMRVDWLKELGLEEPKTVDDLENALREFKNKKGADAAFSFKNYHTDFALQVLGATTSFYVDNGKVQYGPLEQNYKHACERLHRWFKEGLLDPNFVSVDAKILDANVLNGRTGLTIASGGGDLGRWVESKKGEKFEMQGIANPEVTDAVETPYNYYVSNYPGGGSCAISATSSNPELAMRLLDYGYSDEGYMLYNFGIEGVSYTMENGKPTYTDVIFNNPDGLTMTQAMSSYFRSSTEGPFVQSKDYLDQYYFRPQQQASLDNWLKQYDDVKDMQYPPITLTAEEADEYASIMTEVEKYANEARNAFIQGTRDISEFDEVCKVLKELKIERAIEIKQAALDRYLAR